jgi:hypothetical protein
MQIIQPFHNLHTLDLNDNRFSNAMDLASSLGSFTQLKNLMLAENQLKDPTGILILLANLLPPKITNRAVNGGSLSEIHLSGNPLEYPDGTPAQDIEAIYGAKELFEKLKIRFAGATQLSSSTKTDAAIGYLMRNPNSKDKEVAKAVKCAQSTLSSSDRYKRIRAAIKEKRLSELVRGTKYDGKLEAEDEAADDRDE